MLRHQNIVLKNMYVSYKFRLVRCGLWTCMVDEEQIRQSL